ncbi:MAG: methylamine dehydrogenase accessory protein MauD [Gammaproteobacteria bacterium]|jgi:methylamine dehydrogenase accessory protein MauD|nr:methylamine dehydrogenase accessory protein MauD [Gammaproteobacteria bacterium]
MDSYLFEIVMLLAAVVLVLVGAVFALARQIGVLHTRLAPAGALMTTNGPKVGDAAPRLSVPDLTGQPVAIGGVQKQPQLILFVSPTCPVCKELVPTARSLAKSEKLSLIFGSDGGEVQKHADYVKSMKIGSYPYVVSLELGMRFEVSKLPYAALIDEQGVLRSRGLVNSREHLESLVESMRTGYESIQDYLVKEELIGERA